jgi:Ca-activated chloride channel homolog
MNFLAPGAFVLGLLLPVIVALYLLKLRRVEREVPSTFLWRRMVRDVEANAPWQRLRPNLLMILQLLFLIALIFAVTRPFTWTEGAGGEAAIIILDTSASMAAVDVAPSRIESAKQRARQLIDDMPDSARLTIIEAGNEARVLLSSSLDRRQAHLSVQNVRAGTGGSDMAVAIELASAIAARQTGTEIIVLSDGRVNLPDRLSLRGSLRYIPFGLNGENQAISLLTLDAAPGSETLTAFAQISNYGSQPASRRLSIYADGLLFNVFDLEGIAPGGMRGMVIEGLPGETQLIEAVLDGSDTLPLDDRALAVRPDAQPVPITLISPGNLFVRTALSLLPGVILTEQITGAPPPPAEGEEQAETAPTPTAAAIPAAAGSADIIIYDNYVPDVLPSGTSLLFIAPIRSTQYFSTTGVVEQPQPRALDPTDPLLQHISLADVSVLDAVRIPLPEWATPVVAGDLEGENIPLIFRGEVDGRRIAVLAFDLRHSDLPLQVAFPLLWANLIDWLAPGAGSAVPAQANPGEALTINAPEGAQTAAVTLPDRSTVRLQADNGRFLFTNTHQLGLYRLSFPQTNGAGREAAFTVNLFSVLESDLDPADNLPGIAMQGAQAGTGTQQAMREWWRPLAMLALGLLVGEWLVYHRGALVRLRDWIVPARPAAARERAKIRKGF